MHRKFRYLRLRFIGLTVLSFLLMSHPVWATPASFDWGGFDPSGATTFGVYDVDNATVLETGDLVQLIWAGPDGVIDPPGPDGSTSGDDQILDTSTVNNAAPLPPIQQNKGYIPLKGYSFDTEDPQAGGTIYIRAWNVDTASSATAYGDSATGTLTGGATFSAPRWYTSTAVGNTPICPDFEAPLDVVDLQDVQAVASHWRQGDANYDVDQDGDVDIVDVERVVAAWGPCP